MRQKMLDDNYSLRSKSKWVSEAIEQLFTIDNFANLVNYSDDMSQLSQNETISIDQNLKEELARQVVEVKKVFPLMEGVQSRIIRTSILQRILRT